MEQANYTTNRRYKVAEGRMRGAAQRLAERKTAAI
jgi:hypothetical protein